MSVVDSLQVLLGDGALPAEAAFCDPIRSLEVEENADLPGAIQITLRIATQDAGGADDLTLIGDLSA